NILNQRADETIKEGVSELFESNPELANQVYEALGFINNSNFKSTVSNIADDLNYIAGSAGLVYQNLLNRLPNDIDLLSFENNIDDLVTKLENKNLNVLKINNNTLEINGIKVNIDFLNKDLLKSNEEFLKGFPISEQFLGNGIINPEYLKAIKRNDNRDKDVTDLQNQITPQQKQQAQQIYSQYLEQGGKDIEGFKEFVDGKNNLLAQESELNNTVDNQNIQNQKTKQGKIIGQARINELEILIDKNSKNPEVIAHEYAHFYIRRFLNTPIVQEAIAKWGTEEALVQAIGEQAVRQEGDAWNWWVAFSRWIKNLFNKLSDLDRKELRNILTDAFLTNQDLNAIDYGDSASLTTVEQRFPTDREISTELKDQIEKGIVLVPRRTAEGKVENDLYRFDSSKGSWGNYDGEIDIELSPESFVKEYNKNSDPSWRVNTEAALYNRLLELHKRNALHPKNAHNLVTPIDTHNTDKIVKAKGLSMKYPNSSAVIDPAINLRNAEYFLHAKAAVGIQADQISALALLKAANVASLPSIKSEVSGKQIPIFLAPFKVPTIRKNGKDVYTFARMFDTEGNLISNTVSEVLTLDVDAVKNPVIVKMGFNLKTSNLGSTLLAYGVPLDLVENFLEEDDTSVITRWQREIDKNENIYHKGKKLPAERSNFDPEKWLDAKTVEKSNSKLKEEFMKEVEKDYPQSAAEAQGILNFFPYDKSTKTSAHFTLNYNHPTVQGDPTILIRNPVLKLAYFWDLIEISKEYTNVVRALKPDSKPHRSIAEAKIQRELVDKVASGESIISAEDAAKIIPRKNTKSMSVISSFFEAQKFYEKLFSKFFYIEKYGLSDLLLEKIETGYAQSKDMLTKTVTRAQNDFRLKLLYDTYGMNPYAQQVLPAGDDKRPMSPDRIFNGAPSMINKIYSSLQSIKAGTPSTDSMFANVSSGMAERLLNTLFFELNRHERQLDGYTDLIKLAERTATTAGINNTIELFEDVRTFSPELYKMFTAITLYQAGLNNSPYSLIKVMPNDNVDFANNSILSALSHATKIFDAMIGYIEKAKGATAAKQAVDQYVSDFMDWFTVEHGAMVAPLETKSKYMEAALGYRAYNSTKGIYDYYNKNRTYITPTSKFVVDYSAYYAENENRVSKASRETVKLLGADEQAQIQVLENAGFDVKQICEGS
nr:hypothetical protein [Burkholderiales bacterium]